jgi:hypothetical protein
MNRGRFRAGNEAAVDQWMVERRLGGDAHDVEASVPSAWRSAQLRVGVWCGFPSHPREVLTARSLARLDRAERAWRCPACGRPDVWKFTRRDEDR